jgi:hypothetical protein
MVFFSYGLNLSFYRHVLPSTVSQEKIHRSSLAANKNLSDCRGHWNGSGVFLLLLVLTLVLAS